MISKSTCSDSILDRYISAYKVQKSLSFKKSRQFLVLTHRIGVERRRFPGLGPLHSFRPSQNSGLSVWDHDIKRLKFNRNPFLKCRLGIEQAAGPAHSRIGKSIIKHLEFSINGWALFDIFSPFGSILSCPRFRHLSEPGSRRTYGFIPFELNESATRVVENVNGMLMMDRSLSEDGAGCSSFTNCYVKNFPKSMTEAEFVSHFQVYGDIKTAIVMRTREGTSRGVGFVNFCRPQDAARAVEALDGKRISESAKWCVRKAQSKSERQAEVKAKSELSAFVGNLDDTINDEHKLRELFEEFGTITSCTVGLDEESRSKRHGFVTFDTSEAREHAISRMSGRTVGNRRLRVERATTYEERVARLQGCEPVSSPEAQFTQARTELFAAYPTNLPMDHLGTPGIGQQSISCIQQPPPALIPPQPAAFSSQQQRLAGSRPGRGPIPNFNGQMYDPRTVPGIGQQSISCIQQPPPGLIPPQQVPFWYQQERSAEIRPGEGQIPNFDVHFVPRQVPTQGHEHARGRGGNGAPQQQMVPLGEDRLFYNQNAGNASDAAESSQGIIGDSRRRHDIPSVEYKVVPGVVPNTGARQPSSMSALTSLLASMPPDEQRATLKKRLYSRVDELEHDRAEEVTDMLLNNLSQAEVVYLIESPAAALEEKVFEARANILLGKDCLLALR